MGDKITPNKNWSFSCRTVCKNFQTVKCNNCNLQPQLQCHRELKDNYKKPTKMNNNKTKKNPKECYNSILSDIQWVIHRMDELQAEAQKLIENTEKAEDPRIMIDAGRKFDSKLKDGFFNVKGMLIGILKHEGIENKNQAEPVKESNGGESDKLVDIMIVCPICGKDLSFIENLSQSSKWQLTDQEIIAESKEEILEEHYQCSHPELMALKLSTRKKEE